MAAGPLGAQTADTVQLYGAAGASLSVQRQQGLARSTVQTLSNNVLIPSFIGLRVQEDLGGGWKALAQMETTIDLDSGSAGTAVTSTFWDRQALVGLQGDWGRLTLGRQFHALLDRMVHTTDINNAGMLTVHQFPLRILGVNRFANFDNFANNAIKYRLDTPGGLQLGISHALGESSARGTPGSSQSADLAYRDQGLNIGVAWVRYNAGPEAAAPARHEMAVLGGSMTLGAWRPYLSVYRARTGSVFSAALPEQVNQVAHLGLQWTPRPGLDLRAAYYHDRARSLNNLPGVDGRKQTLVLVGQMALSRRTLLNAAWSHNRLHAGYRLDPLYKLLLLGAPESPAHSAGVLSLGMVHLF